MAFNLEHERLSEAIAQWLESNGYPPDPDTELATELFSRPEVIAEVLALAEK